MDVLIQLLAFIITILVLVSFHEAGHYSVAKLMGIKVLRFSIGFGKPIYRYQDKSGTEYVIALIPLGGYVKLLDEREVTVPDSEKHLAFNRQALWKRTLVVLAGPLTNILFAILGFWLMFLVGVETLRPIIGEVIPNSIAAKANVQPGDEIYRVDKKTTPTMQKVIIAIVKRLGEKGYLDLETKNIYSQKAATYHLNLNNWVINNLNPDPLTSLGIKPIRPNLPAVIATIDPDSPAAQAGLKSGDKVLMINNKFIKNWYELVDYIRLHPGQQALIHYQRNHTKDFVKLRIEKKLNFNFRASGYIGIKSKPVNIPSDMILMRHYSPIIAFKVAIMETWQFIGLNFIILKKMFLGQISLSSLGGPISIFETANTALRQGIAVFLGFLSLISVMLAFVNILPIPGLDGGYLLNYLIELIIRKPVSLKFELISIKIGIILLIFLMLLATFNDILRIFFIM